MLNYANLNDIEFEYLCKDIMQRILGMQLRSFAQGKDGGIDLTNDIRSKDIVVQIKHYNKSGVHQLISSLKKEVAKVEELKPKQYYVCCSISLSPERVLEIYNMFSEYMDSDKNILTLNEIDGFLKNAENQDILKKHYKLWLDSTGILEDVLNDDIFVDCEVLLSDIETQKSLFVPTQPYYEALKCLEKQKTLFIIGDPGVGKTMTSKMLVLNFAAQGYRVRYVTNSADLSALKKSLSMDKERREIILVDDCLGQAYFSMKENQENELLSLIKYVNMSKSKLLILNSRVTIYKETQKRKPDLIRSFENKEYDIFVLNMSNMTAIDKAKILYNHLKAKNLPAEYYSDIRKDKRYLDIVNHDNYNPRLIEYISLPTRYELIQPDAYFEYVIKSLNNPWDIWNDEYEYRIQKVDRILVMETYSFSDYEVDIDLVREGFERKISEDDTIDKTINQFESAIERLNGSLIKVVDYKGKKCLTVANPSINDYLRGRLKLNNYERNYLIERAFHYYQIKQLLSYKEYNDWIEVNVTNQNIKKYEFKDEGEKNRIIATIIAKKHIKEYSYKQNIIDFIFLNQNLKFEKYPWYNIDKIKLEFLSEDLYDFYNLKNNFEKSELIIDVLESNDIISMISLINYLDDVLKDEYESFLPMFEELICDAILFYCDNISIEDLDISVLSIMEMFDDDDYFDKESAVEYCNEEAKTALIKDLTSEIYKLPFDTSNIIKYLNGLQFEVSGIELLIDKYIETPPYDYEEEIEDTEDDNDIAYIFERECY